MEESKNKKPAPFQSGFKGKHVRDLLSIEIKQHYVDNVIDSAVATVKLDGFEIIGVKMVGSDAALTTESNQDDILTLLNKLKKYAHNHRRWVLNTEKPEQESLKD